MPKKFPPEFKRDVVTVARRGDLSVAEVAADFDISPEARAGVQVGERRAWRLCSAQRLWSATCRKGRRGAGKTPGPAVHDDLVGSTRPGCPPQPGLLYAVAGDA